ncbi:MAG: trypsin-like peptidase domain-containing protein, partial [Bacteroidetes bacterium]|nr:trypsin-like peptidase domain-containing protein [Bacteroidota bacterium]
MKWRQFFLIVAVSAVSAVGSVWCYSKFINPRSLSVVSADTKLPVNYAGFIDKNNVATPGTAVDFTQAADAAVPAVVHIKTKIPAKKVSNQLPRNNQGGMDDFFNQFFNFGPSIIPEQRGSGSGVLISEDGYIVTNNHVVADGENGTGVADEISVTLSNKKTYKARVIGRDPSSDLAVIKIDGNGFPYLVYGNSDNAKLGQWVLAIGYPLTLETTVTAGIISA